MPPKARAAATRGSRASTPAPAAATLSASQPTPASTLAVTAPLQRHATHQTGIGNAGGGAAGAAAAGGEAISLTQLASNTTVTAMANGASRTAHSNVSQDAAVGSEKPGKTSPAKAKSRARPSQRSTAARRRRSNTNNGNITEESEPESLHLTDSDEERKVRRRANGVKMAIEGSDAPLQPPPSVARRLWQLVANSPRWIRETGRGSDSETDSEDEVITTSYADRRRSQSPYWLREAVKGPDRFRIVNGERRKRVIRRKILPNGEVEQVEELVTDDEGPDNAGEEEDEQQEEEEEDFDDQDEDDGAWCGDKGMIGAGWGSNARAKRTRRKTVSRAKAAKARMAGGLLSADEDDMMALTQEDAGDDATFLEEETGADAAAPASFGIDNIPVGHSLIHRASSMTQPRTRWQGARRWFKLYVRRPGRRLFRWVFAKIVFVLFAMYWCVKEMLKFTFGVTLVWPLMWTTRHLVRIVGVRGTWAVFAAVIALVSVMIAWDVAPGRTPPAWLNPRHWVRVSPANLGDYIPRFQFPSMPSTSSSVPLDATAEQELRLRLDALNNHFQQLSAGVMELSRKQRDAQQRVEHAEDRLGADVNDLATRVKQIEGLEKRVRLELANLVGTTPGVGGIGEEAIKEVIEELAATKVRITELTKRQQQLEAQTAEAMRAAALSGGNTDAYAEGTLPTDLVKRLEDMMASKQDALPGLVEEMVRRQINLALTQAVHTGRVLDLATLRTELVKAEVSGTRGGADISRADERKLRTLIRAELARARADDIAVVDYALQAAGARIITALTTASYRPSPRGLLRKLLYYTLPAVINPYPSTVRAPETALTPTQQLGDCWPVQLADGPDRNEARLTIRLAREIVVDAFTLEHVDARVALDMGTAPRAVELWALADPDRHGLPAGWELDTASGRWARRLTAAEYQIDRDNTGMVNPVQTYWVEDVARGVVARTVQLRVKSNWGRPDQAVCLYRVRVHGREVQTSASGSSGHQGETGDAAA